MRGQLTVAHTCSCFIILFHRFFFSGVYKPIIINHHLLESYSSFASFTPHALKGRCPGLGASALSGRVGQNMRKFSKEVYGNYSFASYLNILTRKRLYTRSFLKDSGKRSERNWKTGASAGDTRYFTSCLNFTFRLWLANVRFVASLPEPIYPAVSS